MGPVVCSKTDTARIGLAQAGNAVQQGAFAAAVGADEAVDAPGGDTERQVVNSSEGTEGLRGAGYLDGVR